MKVQCFYLRRSKAPSVLLSTKDKIIAITFHKNQLLNIRNQYHKDATKFEEPHNITPQQIDDTLKERQIKYQKIVQALDRILCLIGKQEISYQEAQKTAANSDTLWNPWNVLAIFRQVKHRYLWIYEHIHSTLQKPTSTWVHQSKMKRFDWSQNAPLKYDFQK